MAGSIRGVLAVTALACVLGRGLAVGEPSNRYRNPASVCIHLTIADQLPGPALNTAKEEATRIWNRHGVELSWSQPAVETCLATVPIVFDANELLKQGGKSSREALGLTIFSGRSETIYVSASRAFKLLGQTNQIDKTLASQGEWDYRGGLVIGRVIAHELGHVLLTTLAHSKTGLMRPVFSVRDVLSRDEKTTNLTPIETSRLVMRFSLIPFDAPVKEPSALARSGVAR